MGRHLFPQLFIRNSRGLKLQRTSGSPADGPCVPAPQSSSTSLAEDHVPGTGKAGTPQSGVEAGGQAPGKQGLEKRRLLYFWKGGQHFSLSIMTSSSNISSQKASNRITNDTFLI